MKEKIHPQYFKTKATCACGATYEIGSTKKEMRVDICSACHPLFTGKQKLIDTEGRVQKFKKKYAGVKVAAPKKKITKKKALRRFDQLTAQGLPAAAHKKKTAPAKKK